MGVYNYDSQNQELKRISGGTLYADSPIGSEIEYAGTTAPTGFLKCDGSTYSQITYPELYAILGTTTLPNKSGYIIKAKQIGVPADFASAIEDVIVNRATTEKVLNRIGNNATIRNRPSEKTLGLNALDDTNTGISIDFNFQSGSINVYYVLNGVTQGMKSVNLT